MQRRLMQALLSSAEAMARRRRRRGRGRHLLRAVDGVEGGRTETRSHCGQYSPAPALRHKSMDYLLAACNTLGMVKPSLLQL